jgi:protease-4
LSAVIDAIYQDFVAKVAEGRRRSVDEIHELARGRVWTGRDALERGLVDELGGLRDAVRIARKRAGLPDTAPLRHAVHVPPLARLGRPRNSEDPRGLASVTALPDLPSALGLPSGAVLRMPDVRLR